MRLFTLEIGIAQIRSVTNIAPKSSVLSVNKSPILDQSIQFDFRCGVKAIQCSDRIQLLTKRFLNEH